MYWHSVAGHVAVVPGAGYRARTFSVEHTSPRPGTYGHVGLYLTYLFNLGFTLYEYYRTSSYVMLTLCTLCINYTLLHA